MGALFLLSGAMVLTPWRAFRLVSREVRQDSTVSPGPRIALVTQSWWTSNSNVTYDVASTITDYSFVSGTAALQSVTAYGNKDRVTSITYTMTDPNPVELFNYTYDTFGRLSTENRYSNSPTSTVLGVYDFVYTTTINYDKGNQTRKPGFVYDANGNQIDTWTYMDKNNLLKENTKYSFVYDNEGNLIRKAELTSTSDRSENGNRMEYQYDAANRLIGVQIYSGGALTSSIRYRYDSEGNKVEAIWRDINNGVVTNYRYSNINHQVYAQLTSANAIKILYVRGDAVDQLWGQRPGNALVVCHRSHGLRDCHLRRQRHAPAHAPLRCLRQHPQAVGHVL